MVQKAWSNKRERQYDHIKESLIERGRSEDKSRGDRGPNRQHEQSPGRGGQGILKGLTGGHAQQPSGRFQIAWRLAGAHPRPAL